MRGKRSAVYGELTTDRGSSTVMVDRAPSSILTKAGYDPERLDPVIEVLIQNAESGAALLGRYTPSLAALMGKFEEHLMALINTMHAPVVWDGQGEAPKAGMSDELAMVLKLAGNVSVILERINKMTLQSVKSKDDATRLRHFLATGDDDKRGDLANLGENQLRRMIADAAQGWVKEDKAE